MMFGMSGSWVAALLSLLLMSCGGGGGTSAGSSHDLSVNIVGTGTVSSSVPGIDCPGDCSGAYAEGSVVTLTATPGAGAQFVGWNGGGCNGTAPCPVTLSGATTVTATFSQSTVTLSVTKVGLGTVSSLPAGIDCGSDCGEAYASGTTVTLTALPDAGQQFTGWSGGACSGSGTCQVSMTANRGVTANFAAAPAGTFALSLAVSGAGSVSSNTGGINCPTACAATIAQGTSVTLTATPQAAATFLGWSGGGVQRHGRDVWSR